MISMIFTFSSFYPLLFQDHDYLNLKILDIIILYFFRVGKASQKIENVIFSERLQNRIIVYSKNITDF